MRDSCFYGRARRDCFCFFFSSRRRHTRSDRDWSSDVCSSDLLPEATLRLSAFYYYGTPLLHGLQVVNMAVVVAVGAIALALGTLRFSRKDIEIGRAAWRGRGEISGGAVSLKKKREENE